MKFSKDKCRALSPRSKSPFKHHRLETDWLRSSSAEKASGMLVDSKLNMNQQYAPAARTDNSIQGCVNKKIVASLKKTIFFYLALIRLHPGIMYNFQFCDTRKVSIRYDRFSRGQLNSRSWSMSTCTVRKSERVILVQNEEEMASEKYGCIIQHLQEGQQEVAGFFTGIHQVHKTKNICCDSRGPDHTK